MENKSRVWMKWTIVILVILLILSILVISNQQRRIDSLKEIDFKRCEYENNLAGALNTCYSKLTGSTETIRMENCSIYK